MSLKLPRVTGAVLIRALQRAGWYRDHQTGSHVFLRHRDHPGVTVNVPYHAGQIVKPAILSRILNQANLSVEALRDLL